jgi:hypothetical protein
MNPEQAVLASLVKVGLAVALAGTLLRGTWSSCRSFPVYLALVLACDTVVSLWPQRFYVGWFWILQQTAWDLAKLAVAIEILTRALRPFPGTRPGAVTLLTTILILTTLAIMFVPPRHVDPYGSSLIDIQPRVLTATIWLMTGTALLVVWYRIPLDAFPKAILMGFVPYLVVFTSVLNVMRHHGFRYQSQLNLLDAAAYLLVTTWWAIHAWQPAPAVAPRAASLRPRLQEA